METIKEILIRRDGMLPSEADDLIREAKIDLQERLEYEEDTYSICQEWFALEPDYIMELMD